MLKYKEQSLTKEIVQDNLRNDVDNPSILPKKTFNAYKKPLLDLPNLVENQLNSYKRLIEKEI
ncbi:MAG: hypothetical protein QM532_00015 [Cyanobium sp. MAG06]|nr:hypothetical protein [Cyanobium sp. MAG06]